MDAEPVGSRRGGISPGGAADSGEQAEPSVPGEIVRAQRVTVPFAQPDVRQLRTRPGGRVVVEFGIAGVDGLGCAIGYDGRRGVALPEFDTVRVELKSVSANALRSASRL